MDMQTMDMQTRDLRTSRYHEIYARWQRDPLGFWAEAAGEIDWFEKPKTVFDPGAGVYGRWFVGGVCNTCFNALDRHVDAGGRFGPKSGRVALPADIGPVIAA